MNAPHEALLEQETIAFKLNGDDVTAAPGETIIQVADRLGVAIPRLCYKPGMRPDGNCRACMVEIKGERVLAPSCCRQPAAGMEVTSNNERAVHSQRMVLELLAADMPERVYKPDNELDAFVDGWARELAQGPTLTLSLTKTLLSHGLEVSLEQSLEDEARAQAVSLSTEDTREAIRAFVEKRAPRFEGR